MYSTNSISNLLSQSPLLKELTAKLHTIKRLSQIVKQQLPEPLAESCELANIKDDVAVLVTCDPTKKHLLQFMKLDLLSILRQYPNCAGLKSIEVKTDYMKPMASVVTTAPSRPQVKLSQTTISALNDLAASKIHDLRLKQALQSLTATLSKKVK